MLQFLQAKYNIDKIMDMDMGFARAEVLVKVDG